jgi:transposase
MTKPVEVITSVQRRRRWTREKKERIVAAALAPGAVASKVAREAGIHTSQLFRWRQELCVPAPVTAFSPVAVLPEPADAIAPCSPETGVIESEFAGGGRMRITGSVEASTAALMKALSKGKRRRHRSDQIGDRASVPRDGGALSRHHGSREEERHGRIWDVGSGSPTGERRTIDDRKFW